VFSGARGRARYALALRTRRLAFGPFDVEGHPRLADLIDGLRAGGDELIEVNAPMRRSTAYRVITLRQPWRLPLLAGWLATSQARRVVHGRREPGIRRPDAVLGGYLGHFDVRLARLLFRSTPIAVDHLASVAGTAQDPGLGSIAVMMVGTGKDYAWVQRLGDPESSVGRAVCAHDE
jgi:hypothetical protein